MTLDAYLYGDPARILERKQQTALKKQQACTGCIHRIRYEIGGEIVVVCVIKRTAAKRKCELYETERD